MKACKAVLSQSQATEQLEEEFVNNLHCTAQSFSCIKARWFPVPQVREAAMPAGRSQMGLTAACGVDAGMRRCIHSHPAVSILYPSSHGQVRAGLELSSAHQRSSFKQGEEAEALYSLPVPVLPWTPSLWMGGQHPELPWSMIHCRVVLLPSLQTPAWTGDQQKCLLPLLF